MCVVLSSCLQPPQHYLLVHSIYSGYRQRMVVSPNNVAIYFSSASCSITYTLITLAVYGIRNVTLPKLHFVIVIFFSQIIMVNIILCIYNYCVTMYCSTITGCHRKTAACHVTNPSMCYNYCFIVLDCTHPM